MGRDAKEKMRRKGFWEKVSSKGCLGKGGAKEGVLKCALEGMPTKERAVKGYEGVPRKRWSVQEGVRRNQQGCLGRGQ